MFKSTDNLSSRYTYQLQARCHSAALLCVRQSAVEYTHTYNLPDCYSFGNIYLAINHQGNVTFKVNDQGCVGFRAKFAEAYGLAVYHATDTTTATLALMSNLEAASIYSFLFLPAFNNQGIAAKVRLKPGDIGNEHSSPRLRCRGCCGTHTNNCIKDGNRCLLANKLFKSNLDFAPD